MITYVYCRLACLTGAFEIIFSVVYYQISLEGYQIICVRSFSFARPTSFQKHKPVNPDHPKRTSADMELRNYPKP